MWQVGRASRARSMRRSATANDANVLPVCYRLVRAIRDARFTIIGEKQRGIISADITVSLLNIALRNHSTSSSDPVGCLYLFLVYN